MVRTVMVEDKTKGKTLESLDPEWSTNTKKLIGVQDLENRKNVKYAEEFLEEYQRTDTTVHANPEEFNASKDQDYSASLMTSSLIKKLDKVRKFTCSDTIKFYTGSDLPLIAVFFENMDDGDAYRGAMLIAPRIEEK